MWLKLVVSFSVASFVLTKLSGDNVCQEEQRYTVNVTKYFIRNATVRNYQWCLNVPPRCSVYTVKKLNESRIVEEEIVKLVDNCCPGFYEFKNICLPLICSECVHGFCDEKAMKCQCYPGYHGEICTKPCEPMRWGVNCEFDCTCTKGACNSQTGDCICPPGWTGNRCELDCPDGSYGDQCKNLCNCGQFGGNKCNSVTGECTETIDDNEEARNVQIKNDIEIVGNLRSKGLSNPELRKHPVLDKYYTFDYYTTQSSVIIATSVKSGLQKSTTHQEDLSRNEHFDEESSIYNPINETSRDAITTGSTGAPLWHEPEVNNTTMSLQISRSTSRQRDSIKPEQAHVSISMTEQTVMKPNGLEKSKGKVFNDEISTITMSNKTDTNAHNVEKDGKWANDAALSSEDPIRMDNKKALDENNLVFNVITVTGVTVAIIIVAVAIVAIHRGKMKRSKDAIGRNLPEGANAKNQSGMQTVSVYTRSIFHTPLPEPPVFENPVFTTPIEGPSSEMGATFQTHVVCSMNFPSRTNNISNIKDNKDYLYDHPPSTGSYRAASIPEPPDFDSNSLANMAVNEPVYDEIPCWRRPADVTEPPPSYRSSEPSSLYMNTCAKTRF